MAWVRGHGGARVPDGISATLPAEKVFVLGREFKFGCSPFIIFMGGAAR